MSSPLNFKRRRLNESTSSLAKPFVSPLKTASTPLKQTTRRTGSYKPSTLAHTIRAYHQEGQTASTPVAEPPAQPSKATPIRRQQAFTPRSKRSDAAEVAAQKVVSSLEFQIRTIKNEIDTLKQAAQINSSSTDSDLENLAQEWKIAAQTAAEELFGSVKERVCRMGGVSAWKESEKRKHDRSGGFGEFAPEAEEDDDADCEFDSQGEELPEGEQEWRKKEKRRVKKEMMDAAEIDERPQASATTDHVWQNQGADGDTFTVDMMLRSLNIELDLIGYDKTAQRWVS